MTKIWLYLLIINSWVLNAQQVNSIDFETAKVDVLIDAENKNVSGEVFYTYSVIKSIDSIYIDAINTTFTKVKLNGITAKYRVTDTHIIIYNTFKKGDRGKVSFNYQATPKKTMYFINTIEKVQTDLKKIDYKGYFEADDEVGAIFEQIKTTVNQLNRFKGEEQ